MHSSHTKSFLYLSKFSIKHTFSQFVGFWALKNVYPSLHSPQINFLFSSSLSFSPLKQDIFKSGSVSSLLIFPNILLSLVINICKLSKFKNESLTFTFWFNSKLLRFNKERFLQFLNIEFIVSKLVVLKEDKFNSVKLMQFSKALFIVLI